ncbi:unnamed protein product [Rotaria socialis]|uniref:TTF-type domain-containing protein n=1 Tax=Rotaria socialis TaxID=392032 RepID=A0A818TM46_9BILA|nr:unnamed protein product [Rotaria socialis]
MRPVLSSYPVNHENRSFQSQWYQNRPWLEYSIKNDSAYCYCCRHFGESVQTKCFQSDAFTTGFNAWRRALEKDRGFDKHVKTIKYLIGQELYKDEGIVISNAWIKEYLNERENFIVNDEDKKLNVNENRGEVFDDDDDWNELDDKPISPGAILKYC